ncbi:MAG: Gfo/Idh/MocA family oxidoreductase [Candidatus Omnitrophica bacterium]|nr:Gfo/Idh/MocA family oxidoreductase [Candidatus Omnitrophota bacterium]
MIRVGIIGCGYWGPNLVRNFNQFSDSRAQACCDLNDSRLEHMRMFYPGIETTNDYKELLKDPSIDAVCISTPIRTHYSIVKESLLSGKHVLVEKPMACSTKEAKDLIELAKRGDRVLMAGHTFLYAPAINKMKKIIESGDIGEVYYISSSRLNLGLFQQDINVVWDLAPHDLSIVNYLLSEEAVAVRATGFSHICKGIEDVAFLICEYPKGVIAHFHVSWLDPCKVRRLVVVGSKKMIVYDDLDPEEPLKIYDKGITKQPYYDTFGEFKLLYRHGDTHSPRVSNDEPLKLECMDFLESIKSKGSPRSGGESGLAVVKVLEAAQRSLENKGRTEKI